jgi:hypothetical protein
MDSKERYEEQIRQSTEASQTEQQADEKKTGHRSRRHPILLAISALLISCGNGVAFAAAVLVAKRTGRLWLSLILMLIIASLTFAVMLFIIKKMLKNSTKSD